MRRRRQQLQVSTFPFLAVLLCAMGALILVLLIMDRRSHLAAQQKAHLAAEQTLKQRQADHDKLVAQRQREHEGKKRTQKQAWEAKRARLQERVHGEELTLEQELALVQARLAEAAEKLRKEQSGVDDLRKQLEGEKARVARQEKAVADARDEANGAVKQLSSSDQVRARLATELARLEAALKELRESRKHDSQTYSLIPYHGKRGDNRRPIYVECSAAGHVFHPDKKTMTSRDDLRAELKRRLEAQRERLKAAGLGERDPYVMLLVRPDGVLRHYEMQAAARDLGIDFGYEFVEQDWALQMPDDNSPPPATLAVKPENAAPGIPRTSMSPGSLPLGTIGEGNRGVQGGVNPGAGSGGLLGQGASPVGMNKGGVPGSSAAGSATIGPVVRQGSAGTPGVGTAPGSVSNASGGRNLTQIGTPGIAPDARCSHAGGGSAGGGGMSGGLPGSLGTNRQPGELVGKGLNTTGPAQGRAVPLAPWELGGNASGTTASAGQPRGQGDAPAGSAGTPGVASGVPGNQTPAARLVAPGIGQGKPPGADGGNPDAPVLPPLGAAGQQGSPSGGQGNAGNAACKNGNCPPQADQIGPPSLLPDLDRSSAKAGPPLKGTATSPSASPPDKNIVTLGPTVPQPAERKQQPRQLRPARVGGDGETIIFVECRSDVVVLYPSRRRLAIESLNHSPGYNPLVAAVRQQVQRRQGQAKAGEQPRIQVRFLVHREGEQSFHLAYPAIESLKLPMTRYGLLPWDDVEKIVSE